MHECILKRVRKSVCGGLKRRVQDREREREREKVSKSERGWGIPRRKS